MTLVGEIEERRKHPGRQFDRHFLHPVERLANRKIFQNVDRAFTDQRLEFCELLGATVGATAAADLCSGSSIVMNDCA